MAAPGATSDDATAPLFSLSARRRSIVLSAAGVAVVAVTGFALSSSDAFVLALAATIFGYGVPALVLTRRACRRSDQTLTRFWGPWEVGLGCFLLGTALLAVAVVPDAMPLLAAGIAIITVGFLYFGYAAIRVLFTLSGGRDPWVDLIDVAMVTLLVGAPMAYFVIEPALARSDDPFGVALAVGAALQAPAGIVLSATNVRLAGDRHEPTLRAALLLAAVSAVNLVAQGWQALDDFALPFAPLLAVNAVNWAVMVALPLTARRNPLHGLEQLPADQQVRLRDPVPVLVVAVVPALAATVLLDDTDRPWGPGFLVAVLATLLGLAVLRNALARRETRRLYRELARVSDERARLVRSLIAVLEADRHAMASELHEQAIGAHATLGTLTQTAAATLPPDTAELVRQAVAGVQSDIRRRAEALRRLVLALRPAELDGGGLTAALEAFAAELLAGGANPRISVTTDDELVLDWTTQTLTYRIAQEALREAVERPDCHEVEVAAHLDGTGVVIAIRADGTPTPDRASTLSAIERFATLGGGTVAVTSSEVRVRLDPHGPAGDDARLSHDPTRRHLLVVPGHRPIPDEEPSDQGSDSEPDRAAQPVEPDPHDPDVRVSEASDDPPAAPPEAPVGVAAFLPARARSSSSRPRRPSRPPST